MRRSTRALKASLMAGALLIGACGSDDGGSLAGTYECGAEDGTEVENWELKADETLSIEAPDHPVPGTWSVEADSVTISILGGEQQGTMSVDGDRLVAPAGEAFPASPDGDFICTPVS